MYSRYQQYNQDSSRVQTTSQQSSTNHTTIPPNPVQTYTEYYHAWTKRHAELSRCHSSTSENDRQWAKYYAEESSRAAHHFYENPHATSVPFSLPPAPPPATTGSLPVTAPASSSSANKSNSAGSVTRYVKRNMERRELENDPLLKKRVQAEIEAQIASAIQNGSFQSKNWDDLPLIGLNIHATSAVSSKSPVPQQQQQNRYSSIPSSGTSNGHYQNNNIIGQNIAQNDCYRSTDGISNFNNYHYGPSSHNHNNPLQGVSHLKPSPLLSPSFSYSSSQHLIGNNNKYIHQNNKLLNNDYQYHHQQEEKEEDFMTFDSYYGPSSGSNGTKKKRKMNIDPKAINKGGLDVSKQTLNKRASRFHANDRSIVGGSGDSNDDKYMGKRLIGGMNIKLDAVDYERMTVKGTSSKMEKDYLRLTAPPRPELVRPIGILKKHLHNLQVEYYRLNYNGNDSLLTELKFDSDILVILHKRMRTPQDKWNIADGNHDGNSLNMSNNRPRRDYLWFCSQLKAIRQDCTVQRIQGDFSVDVYETHARIALQEGDLNEYNQCQTQLKELYKISPSADNNESVKINESGSIGNDNTPSFVWKNQEEFLAYRVLYYLYLSTNEKYSGGSSDMCHIMRSLTPKEKNHPAIQHALNVREAIAFSDYYFFFRLHQLSPNLGTFFTNFLVPNIRFRTLKRIAKAYRPSIELSFCLDQLGFLKECESHEDRNIDVEVGKSWLSSCGCILDKDKLITKDSVIHPPDTKKSSLI